MNIYALDTRQLGELLDEHLDAMAEAQYDCDDDQADGNPHTRRTEADRTDEDLPF